MALIANLVYIFMMISIVIPTSNGSSLFHMESKRYSAVPIEGVAGKAAQLPCNMTSAPNDSVYLVLWFKEGLTTPIYSYDVRELLSGEPKHWWDSDLLDSRAFFNAHSNPAHLLLRHVTPEDAGLYKCRVDFQREPTRNSRVNLTVIVPPQEIMILDADGRLLDGEVGPIAEGSGLNLSCIAKGGEPPPKLLWKLNGNTIDDTMEEDADGRVRNDVIITALERHLIGSHISCDVIYHPNFPPIQKRVTLKMNLAPLRTEVLLPEEPLSSGRSYVFVCTSEGSKPPADLTWWMGFQRIHPFESETLLNSSVSRSKVKLSLNASDNGKKLLCEAENPLIPSAVIQGELILNVFYSPRVKIGFGPISSAKDVMQGDSVLMNCVVDSNPPPYKVVWKRNEVILSHENSANTLFSNWSLLLQDVVSSHEGNYSCIASNVEGDGVSRRIPIKVMHPPVCESAEAQVIGASMGEEKIITCHVKAHPQPIIYHWWFDSSDDLGPEQLWSRHPGFPNGKRGSTLLENYVGKRKGKKKRMDRRISFTPSSDRDFGMILCYAQNEIGKQEKPCIFQMVRASIPPAPFGCLHYNLTSSDVSVKCSIGEGEKSNQTFFLDIVTDKPRKVIASLSAPYPRFDVKGLDADGIFHVFIYVKNEHGKSEVTHLTLRTLKPPVKQLETRLGTEERTDKSSTFLLLGFEAASIAGAFSGGIIVVVLFFLAALFSLKRRRLATANDEKTTSLSESVSPEFSPENEFSEKGSKDHQVLSSSDNQINPFHNKYGKITEQKEIIKENEFPKLLSGSDRNHLDKKKSILKKQRTESSILGEANIKSNDDLKCKFEESTSTLQKGARKDISNRRLSHSISSSENIDRSFVDLSSEELVSYIKPLGLPIKENSKSQNNYLNGSQTLPFLSRTDKSRIKQTDYITEDFKIRPPDLISCSSTPPSPAPKDFNSSVSYPYDALFLEQLSKKQSEEDLSPLDSPKRESRV